jgi:DNA-binding IclR family transcriptional regulator
MDTLTVQPPPLKQTLFAAPSRVPQQDKAVATSFLKGLDVLTVLARRREGLTMTLLTRKLKQPRTTVLRLLATLESYGLVARNDRIWFATEQFYQWSSRETHREIAERYRPAMQTIAAEVDELVGIGIGEAQGMRYFHWEAGTQPGTTEPPDRDVYPLHRTAAGKLVLTQRPDLMDPAMDCQLQAEIQQARETGVAWCRRECTPQDISIATWVAAPSATTPVIFVSWPVLRFTEAKALNALTVIRRELARPRR